MTAPRVDPDPFDFEADARTAALCLHGLTGTPYEVRSLGEALAARGVRALGPVLPGHNDTPEALAAVPHEAWLEAARTQLRALRERHERVALVGLSMGGLVSLALAAEEPVDAVAVVGVPLRFRHPAARLVPLLKYLVRQLPKRAGSDIQLESARRRHPSYPSMPLAAVHELMQLQRRVQDALGSITAPLLVAHGAKDGTADPRDAGDIHRGVASSERELMICESSGHIVTVDHDAATLARAVADFVERHTGVSKGSKAAPASPRVLPRPSV